MIINLNEDINKINNNFGILGNINTSNILLYEDRSNIINYKTLFLYDYIICGYIFTKRNNLSRKIDLEDIGNLIEQLFNANHTQSNGDQDNIFEFGVLDYQVVLKKNIKTSCFLSLIIEKIKKGISWDNYYIASKYNILYQSEKNATVYLPEYDCTGFFCEIECEGFPFKKALITKYLGSKIESLKIKYMENNSPKTVKIESYNRYIYPFDEEEFTFIQLEDSDQIKNFFVIDENYFKDDYYNEQIILFQNLDKSQFEDELYYSVGNYRGTFGESLTSFLFDADTIDNAIGSPIVLSSKSNYLIGMCIGNEDNSKFKKAISINKILISVKNECNKNCNII